MARDWVGMIQRGVKKPPHVIAKRLVGEAYAGWQRFDAPGRERRLSVQALLGRTGHTSLASLWEALAARPYPTPVGSLDGAAYEALCPGDTKRILAAAELALAREVDLLGSGPVALGTAIAWNRDYKTGFSWPNAYCKAIDYNNPDRPSDVKMAWELSRLQWLLPAGQAYVLTGDDRYAMAVRDVLESWIAANPYAYSVNWACTMEVALRVVTWTWFFQVFHDAEGWCDEAFRARFLRSLYMHVDFTARNLEESDVNGNHYTADAAGLVVGGLFFPGHEARSWADLGWRILVDELPKQVFADGVDYEASVPYHRLVLELFLLPAMHRRAAGLPVTEAYMARLGAMVDFSAAYGRPDGTVPLWGDADDARVLPLGGQSLNDHRYLAGLGGVFLGRPDLSAAFGGSRSEIAWWLGLEQAAALPGENRGLVSRAFAEGGFYVMRTVRDHIFIDCGPIGLAGRGGHGHNDCLAFEAVLDGVTLVSDCGAYLYTASYEERNRFRATASHNTPQIDGAEINRFIRPDYLWNMHDDARPEPRRWVPGPDRDVFTGAHTGYMRLAAPVKPVRTVALVHDCHALIVQDSFEGIGEHAVEVPLHLAPGVSATTVAPGHIRLDAAGRAFDLVWGDTAAWALDIGEGRVSPSYGVAVDVTRLTWRREGPLTSLLMCLAPAGALPDEALGWAADVVRP